MGELLSASSIVTCPHGGMVTAVPSSATVSLGGDPIVLATDTFMIAGCAFSPGYASPCVLVQWQLPAQSSTSGNIATLTTDSFGLCMAATGAAQGPAIVQSTQTRVSGT